MILFILIGMYSVQKFEILMNRRDVDLLAETTFNALTEADQFDYSNGFKIAAAFINYDNETALFDDPTVGELAFYHYGWSRNPDGSSFAGRNKLKSHKCSRAELGLELKEDETLMFPIQANFKKDFEVYHSQFLCVDREDLHIFGDYNTQSAKLFNIQFIKCHDRPDCKKEDEIIQFLRNKFIATVYNEITFNANERGAQSLNRASRLVWNPINTQI